MLSKCVKNICPTTAYYPTYLTKGSFAAFDGGGFFVHKAHFSRMQKQIKLVYFLALYIIDNFRSFFL